MVNSDFIIDVNEADFEYQVLAYSQQVPVIVDFWAEWCIPCKALSPTLERLAEEAQGGFRLAKVNVDSNPNLSARYNIRSIPAVKAFKDGRMVSEFTGVIPEPQVREFIQKIAPSQSDLLIEKGNSLLLSRQPSKAEKAFREALDRNPVSSAAMLGLAKSLLLEGRGEAAMEILKGFPISRELAKVEMIVPLAEAMVKVELDQFTMQSDLDAAFYNAIRLTMRNNLPAAMDGLLDLLRLDKRYHNGLARKVLVALFELCGEDDPMTREYRNELASILF